MKIQILVFMALTAAGLVALAACATSSPARESDSSTTQSPPKSEWNIQASDTDQTLLLTPASPPASSMHAVFEGVLSTTSGGCLGLESEGSIIPISFPIGTVLGEGNSISVEGQTFSMGDSVSVTGGTVVGSPIECESNADVLQATSVSVG